MINDQWARLKPIAEAVDLNAFRWHGDVSASHKKVALNNPGILIITPESLEAGLMSSTSEFKNAMRGIQTYIVDEIHAFIGSERGAHLQSLMHRVDKYVDGLPQRIGMSATVNDLRSVADFLRPRHGSDVVIVESVGSSSGIKLQVRGYLAPTAAVAISAGDEGDEEAQVVERDIAVDVYRHMRGSSNLVFANKKSAVELFASLLREQCENAKQPNEFFPHHGSLSRELRQDLEYRLRDSGIPTTAICTSTLELGIDIGKVTSIGQIGPPFNVASIRQRLGRSGRRGEEAVLRIYVPEPMLDVKTSLIDELRVDLVQTIAVVELLLLRWYEPPNPAALHLSTVVHQVLALLVEYGTASAKSLYRMMCETGSFTQISQTEFGQVLRSMGNHDLIQQEDDGKLVIGVRGEQITGKYDFYAAFATHEEFTLISSEQTLGKIPIDFLPREGELIVFAGRRWRVVSLDNQRKTILVKSARGGHPPRFGGFGGTVHAESRQKMLEIYSSKTTYEYLDTYANQLLQEARDSFHTRGLDACQVVATGNDTYLFPWCGDPAIRAITLMLSANGLDASIEGPAIRIDDTPLSSVVHTIEKNVAGVGANPEEILESVKRLDVEKFHWVLSDSLHRKDYCSQALDFQAATQWTDEFRK